MIDIGERNKEQLKTLVKYLKNYKWECVLSPLFKMFEAILELFVPFVMARIINVGIETGDRSYIIKMCLVLVALGLTGLICSVTAQFFAAKAAVGFATKLRHALFSHIQSLSFSEMDTIGTSTLITRMTSDVNQVQNGVNMTLRLLLRSPFVVLGAMIMAFATIDVKAALVFVVVIPVLSITVVLIMYITIPLYRKTQKGLDRVLLLTRENLTGARVIRAFNKEAEEVENFEEENATLTRLQEFVGKISSLMNPLTFVIINSGIIALLYVGGLQVNAGVINNGDVVALVNYMSMILVELVKFANLVITITKALASAKRIEAVMLTESSIKDAGEAMDTNHTTLTKQEKETPFIEFKNVSFTYAGAGESAISGISFQVNKGETVGIIGGTGCGKSTIVNLIPRYYDATTGEVLMNGKNVKQLPLETLREQVGMVMQKAVLFKGTIEENLRWGKEDATEEELWRALEISQAKEVVLGKQAQLKEPVEQGGKNFSGGQKQRLTIARALVRNPEILILDDSASALDFATDARLRSALKNMSENRTEPMTTFIVSQRTSSIQHADKILVLEDGELVDIGTHEELLKRCEEYQEIHYSQISESEVPNEN